MAGAGGGGQKVGETMKLLILLLAFELACMAALGMFWLDDAEFKEIRGD